MKYLLLFLLFACAPTDTKEKALERELVVYVCYNPESIWHLSECNEACTDGFHNGDAYCIGLFNVACEQPNREPFINQACGLYYD